jgi:hypothetical protein
MKKQLQAIFSLLNTCISISQIGLINLTMAPLLCIFVKMIQGNLYPDKYIWKWKVSLLAALLVSQDIGWGSLPELLRGLSEHLKTAAKLC